MAPQPTIAFELEIAPLLPKNTNGIPGSALPGEVVETGIDTGTPAGAAPPRFTPLGLRWRVKPELGIPRRPFFLWRRAKSKGDPIDKRYGTAQVNSFFTGNGVCNIPGGPFYILHININNNHPTQALTVQALNTTMAPILLHALSVPANTQATIRFQHPFIGGFSAKGNFTIKSVTGVTMKNFIDRPEEWELIQMVGLPAGQNEVTGYDSGEQGYVSQPGDPVDNALKRVRIAQYFYQPLATSLPSGLQVPVWEIPDPQQATDELRKGSPPLLKRIAAMFEAVDKGKVHEQADFRVQEVVPGIRQPEFPGSSTPDATIDLPLLATVLINAITDPWFSLSAGFGATDFPSPATRPDKTLEPGSYFYISHDYMVTSKFVFRFDGEVFTDPEYAEEYCALSHKSLAAPLPALGLVSNIFSLNRPPHRDEAWSAEAALTWTKLNQFQIQGNAIAVGETGTNGAYLNTLRPAAVAHQPALFVPMKPGGTSDPQLATKNRFIHSQTFIPFTGSRINQYGVATMDCFARWSDWREAQLTLFARPPESPRLIALSLKADKTRITGNTCPHELAIEVLWDWQDRSPKTLQFAGVFHRRISFADGTRDNGHIPPTDYPAIFQADNTAAAGSLLELSFASDTPPGTPPVFTSTPSAANPSILVELLPQTVNQGGQIIDGEMRRYRVTIPDISLAFNPEEEWFFTVFVKAAEWRAPVQFSDSILPIAPGRPPKLTTYIPNPIPAPPPVFDPPDIIWAPLPDARGISRFRLSFTKIPNATGGYAVYRAFEAKIRDNAALPVRSDTDLVSRATDLRDIAMPLEKCIDAFTRLNEKLIPPPAGPTVDYEVEIPGTLDGLMVFAVASVTKEQETSAMSTPWLFVAVPRRSVPGLPVLSLQQLNGSASLLCEFPKAPKPSVVEIFRSRKELFANETDTMGIAIQQVTEAAWEPVDQNNNPVPDPASLHHFRLLVNDPVTPSWFPYFYRALSTGVTDTVQGLIAARSQQSNLVKVEKLPTTLPLIAELKATQKTNTSVTLSFKSDAVPEVTPRGSFRLEIFSWNFTTKEFNATPAAALFLTKALPVAALPVKGQVYFSETDAAGQRSFLVELDVTGPAYLFRVRLADPLTRTAEKMVSGEISATPTTTVNLSNATAAKSGRDLLVFFESTTPFIAPFFGNFVLDITFTGRGSHSNGLLMRKIFSQILPGKLDRIRQSPVTAILRDNTGHLPQPIKYGAIFKRFYPAVMIQSVKGVILIRLRAPDNSTAVITIQI